MPNLSCIFSILVLTFFTLINHSKSSTWKSGAATWYGNSNGCGTTGGACGYGDAVDKSPFSSLIVASGSPLFKSGMGCGACYQIKCVGHSSCSGNPVSVVMGDYCPGGSCSSGSIDFDMSGAAFGAMAIKGQENQLRNAGLINVEYARVPCNYPGFSTAFKVDPGSNQYYLAVIIMYLPGDGDIKCVEIMQKGSKSWTEMQQSWGAVWKLNSGSKLQAPFSFRVTTLTSCKTFVFNNVIPNGWQLGVTYWSGQHE